MKTTTWNYRIVKVDTADGPMWGLYEVYYEDERPVARTENPIEFIGEGGPEEIMDALTHALDTAVLHGALNDSEIGGGEVD